MSRESELRWASLISGGGTTMNAMAEACRQGELAGLVQPVVVISSREKVDGLRKAQCWDIPIETVARKEYPKGLEGIDKYGRALKKVLAEYNPDIVTLNGFLAMVSEEVVDAYDGNIFNQHPGPPEFGGVGMHGKAVHCAVIIYGQKLRLNPYHTQVIAQRVSPFDYDKGAIIKYQNVEVLQTDQPDSPEDLQQRALPIEHQLQIALLKDAANGVIKEVSRDPFVRPMHYEIMYSAMKQAKEKYPNG